MTCHGSREPHPVDGIGSWFEAKSKFVLSCVAMFYLIEDGLATCGIFAHFCAGLGCLLWI